MTAPSTLVSRDGSPEGPTVRPSLVKRIQRRLGWPQILTLLLTLIVGFLVLYPVVMLLIGSVAPPNATDDQGFTLDGYRTALADTAARKALWTTFWLSLVRALGATIVALFLAWAIQRTNLPGRKLFHRLMLVAFFMPLLPQVLAWIFLFSPRSGLVNEAMRSLVGSEAVSGPFDIFSYEGIIFVGIVNWSAFLYLFISPAFRAVDASLEEAARMSGASGFLTMRRISVPLLWPAVLGAFGLSFVRQAESFETELLLGVPANIYVFTTQIYKYIGQDLVPRYGPAIALSTIFIIATTLLILLQQWILRGRDFATVRGKDYRSRPSKLGRWTYPVLAVLILYNVVGIILPTLFLMLGSVQRTVAQFKLDAFTFDHWSVLSDGRVIDSIRNTLVVGILASTIALALVTLVSYVVMRTRLRLRRVLDAFTWVPYMIPSFVLGLGFLWVALRGIEFPIALYGSIFLITIAFIVRLMPLGSRLMNGTMVQISHELEEAARVSGAGWGRAFRKVILPILLPALGIGWLMFMAVVIRDLSTVILIFGPETQLLSVQFFAYWRTGTLEGAAVLGLVMTVLGVLMALGFFALQRFTGGREEASMF